VEVPCASRRCETDIRVTGRNQSKTGICSHCSHHTADKRQFHLQARATPAGRAQEAGQAHYGHDAGPAGRRGSVGQQGLLFRGSRQGQPMVSAGQPRRGFGSGTPVPLRAPAGAAAAAAAAFKVSPSPRSSSDSLGRQSVELITVASSLERQGGRGSDQAQSTAHSQKAADGQEVPAMMRYPTILTLLKKMLQFLRAMLEHCCLDLREQCHNLIP